MPQEINRIGRGTEWATRYYLLRTESAKRDMEKYLNLLPPEKQKRVLVGAEKIAEKIIFMNKSRNVRNVDVIGEESKKPGSEDYDIMVYFDDNSQKGYSLKIQGSSRNVNVRNFTLNSLCKSFTGKKFEDFLTGDEIEWYSKMGIAYSEDKIASEVLGKWGALKLSKTLNDVLKSDPRKLIETMLKEIRYKTNLLMAVVDKKGEFRGYVTKFVDLFSKMESNLEKIEIIPRGISVHVLFDKIRLLHLDLYMMSSSLGKGKKLRGAIRVNFKIDETA